MTESQSDSSEFANRLQDLQRQAKNLARKRGKDTVEKANQMIADITGDEDWEGHLEKHLDGLEEEISNLVKSADKNIHEHPIAATAAAFALGVLVGRLTK